jgi:hypothetical protein
MLTATVTPPVTFAATEPGDGGHDGPGLRPDKVASTEEAGFLPEDCRDSLLVRPIDDGVLGGGYLTVPEDRRDYR